MAGSSLRTTACHLPVCVLLGYHPYLQNPDTDPDRIEFDLHHTQVPDDTEDWSDARSPVRVMLSPGRGNVVFRDLRALGGWFPNLAEVHVMAKSLWAWEEEADR